MSSIQQIVIDLAGHLQLDANELTAYALEDVVGGYHIDESQRKWAMGSLWQSEGQILYALVRALKPAVVVEVGGWVGCSAAHIATALRANGGGKLYSVDNGVGGVQHGSAFPSELSPYVELIQANGEDWLAQQADGSLDIVFEDADHTTALVALVSKIAMQKLKPGGVLVNHDAAHDTAIIGGGQIIDSPVGKWVRDGLDQAGVAFRLYKGDESDCGVAVSQKMGAYRPVEKNIAPMQPIEPEPEPDASPVDETPQFDNTTTTPLAVETLLETQANLESEQRPMGEMLHEVWPELYPEAPAREEIRAEAEPIPQPEKPIKRKPGRKPKAKAE